MMEVPDRPEWWQILLASAWVIDPPYQISDILKFVRVYAAAATLSDEEARAYIQQAAGRALIARISEQIGDPVPQP
jgi:hypothetical protein